jgi:uncharacterized protein YqiB (DUF1249 family)
MEGQEGGLCLVFDLLPRSIARQQRLGEAQRLVKVFVPSEQMFRAKARYILANNKVEKKDRTHRLSIAKLSQLNW